MYSSVDESPLGRAIKEINLEAVKALIESGYDIHQDNDTLAYAAACNESPEIILELIKAGADVHENNELALRLATVCDHLTIVTVLVAAGSRLTEEQLQTLPDGPCKEYIVSAPSLFTKSAMKR